MTFEQFIFYMLATIAVIAGLMMITVKNPVKAALWLVMAFVSTAGIWLMAEAEFLGLVLILIYVGAVMVLFMFVVMMLDINIAVLKEGFIEYLPLGAMAALAIFAIMYVILGPEHFGLEHYPVPDRKPADYSNTKALGVPLYTTHAYAFVLAAVLLLLGIVAAIALTLRRRPTTEVLYQDVAKQNSTLKEDRFRMVKMDAVVEKDIEPEVKEDDK